MPAGQQIDPPELDHIAPKWFHDWVARFLIWCIANRPVAGIGIFVSDAPGGGAQIACNVKAVAQAIGGPKLGFEYYPSPYTGDGDSPVDQPLKIRLYSGQINGAIIPSNMASEFTLQNNQTNYLKLTLTNDVDGFPTSGVLSVGTSAGSADPSGSLNVAPATTTRVLWTFTTAGNKITSSVAGRLGDLDVMPIAYKLACGGAYVKIFWGPSAQV